MRDIHKIILHCTATKPDQDICAADVDEWHRARGWRGIGYHYLIKLNGSVELGRPLDEIGAHCKGQNMGSVGIAYAGGLNDRGKPEDTMNEMQEIAWMQLVRSLRMLFGPMSVHGHNEFSAKACPSFDVQQKYGWMNQNQK